MWLPEPNRVPSCASLPDFHEPVDGPSLSAPAAEEALGLAGKLADDLGRRLDASHATDRFAGPVRHGLNGSADVAGDGQLLEPAHGHAVAGGTFTSPTTSPWKASTAAMEERRARWGAPGWSRANVSLRRVSMGLAAISAST